MYVIKSKANKGVCVYVSSPNVSQEQQYDAIFPSLVITDHKKTKRHFILPALERKKIKILTLVQ